MNKVFVEENGVYQIDCTKAIWATDAVHEIYHNNKVSLLKDIDFIVEEDRNIILMEYKNGNNPSNFHCFLLIIAKNNAIAITSIKTVPLLIKPTVQNKSAQIRFKVQFFLSL